MNFLNNIDKNAIWVKLFPQEINNIMAKACLAIIFIYCVIIYQYYLKKLWCPLL